MTDPNLKTIREIVYYTLDHRATAAEPYATQGFILDEEAGDKATLYDSGPVADEIVFTHRNKKDPSKNVLVIITVPRGGYLFRADRTFQRPRKDDEVLP